MTQVITHRGLRPSQSDFFSESSVEAFEAFLQRGWGLEFDPAFATDGIAVTHDTTLTRLTNGHDKRYVKDVSLHDLLTIPLKNGRLCTLDELLDLIVRYGVGNNALHFKGGYQNPENTERLIEVLKDHPKALELLFVFDATPQIAKQLKAALPTLKIGASVAHPYDIQRYQKCVYGTLLTLDEAIAHKDLYSWVWLDEWDLTDSDGGPKDLYNRDVFAKAKKAGFKVALVTPELHGTSPGLLGGEAHPDASDRDTLFNRIEQIILLQPDAICTDYPDEAETLIAESIHSIAKTD
ncbi:MAG: glycerophosphodiester phosphodiesterase family protein [Chlamydiales bacterium]|nr:glycerophosphodiester phosphodiesterase family protein [Chlamydiales bacterium]